jgi:DNA-binding NarL/FixJ family response regulator
MARVRKPISIVLVDDNPLAREGVVALIRAQPGFHVLAASAKIEQALRRVRAIKPDMVLLNLPREGHGSLMLAGALHGQVPESRVIIMGLEPLHEDVASFVRAGVSGFIMAYASFDKFLSTIRSVARGIQVLPFELTRSLFGQLNGLGVRRRPKRTLDGKRPTNRERAVTDLIVQGLSNQEIAARLSIPLHTVKSHVHKMLSKLAVNSGLEVGAFSRNRAAPAMVPRPPLGSVARS